MAAASRRVTKKLPSICVDEHMHPRVAAAFRETFRTVEVAKTERFKGRDERDFLGELYSENAIFATSDGEFVNEAIENDRLHAGIIFIPKEMTADEKVLFAQIAGGFIRGGCSASRHVFRRRVVYAGHDGLRTVAKKSDSMEFSWAWLSQMLNTDS